MNATEEKAIKMLEEGLRGNVIAQRLGLSTSVICYYNQIRKARSGDKSVLNSEAYGKIDKISQMAKEGYSLYATATELGLSWRHVRVAAEYVGVEFVKRTSKDTLSKLKKEGVRPGSGRKPISSGPSPDWKKTAIALYKAGWSAEKIAGDHLVNNSVEAVKKLLSDIDQKNQERDCKRIRIGRYLDITDQCGLTATPISESNFMRSGAVRCPLTNTPLDGGGVIDT